jgi:dipeptidyl aminopeptidase/acylaminoacyl peptidase
LALSGPDLARRGAPLSFSGTAGGPTIGWANELERNLMLNRTTLIRTNLPLLALAVAAVVALLIPGAAAARSSGGAVVFSRVVTKTTKEAVKDAEGKPVKDAEGKEQFKETVTREGGLYAVREGRLNQLTEDPSDTEPSFSPNSRAIVFSRDGDIFSVRADGSGLRRITGGPQLDTAPNVAPNGSYALFERRTQLGAPADLYTVSLNGGVPSALTSSPDDDHEASFSADGRTIVFVHSVPETGGGTADDLYSVRPSGAGLRRLTKTGRVDEWDPHYFAGGIAYSRGQSGEGPSAFADIYTMRRNGKTPRTQVAGAGSAYVEDVSPDGHTLLFRRDQGLWVKRIGNGRARKLSQLPDNSDTNAVFSSDGARVAAFVEAEERTQLSAISVADGSSSELAQGVVPSEATPTSGTVTTIGPVIAWQPTRG